MDLPFLAAFAYHNVFVGQFACKGKAVPQTPFANGNEVD